MRTITAIIVTLLATLTLCAQKTTEHYHCIGFYNAENLFDTIHDAGRNDYEFLPKGTNRWNSEKYTNKIANIASVLSQLGRSQQPSGATIVGMCEIENSNVLDDLVKHPALARKGWKYLHAESEDTRGVDCALLYNPQFFTPKEKRLIAYGNGRKTRGFLVVSGTIANEQFHIIVNHWPSRYSKSPTREYAATRVRAIKDSIAKCHPTTKIIVMGDFNDNPDNISLRDSLRTHRNIAAVKSVSDLYNPFGEIYATNLCGTLKYKGRWQLYDQILVNGNLCGKRSKGVKYDKCEIHAPEHLMTTEGKYKGYPKRTQANGVWLNGYSDHLPVVIYLK